MFIRTEDSGQRADDLRQGFFLKRVELRDIQLFDRPVFAKFDRVRNRSPVSYGFGADNSKLKSYLM